MTVHILGSGMSYDIHTKLKRITVNRCCKGIIYNKRHLMVMRCFCKLLKIQNNQCRIGNGFCHHTFGIRTECLVNLFNRPVRVHNRALNSHLLHSYNKQIKGSPINHGGHHHMVSGLTDIKYGIIISRLTG